MTANENGRYDIEFTTRSGAKTMERNLLRESVRLINMDNMEKPMRSKEDNKKDIVVKVPENGYEVNEKV